MADAITIIIAGFLGGIGMGLAQKIVEYYWETKLKHRMVKIDNAGKAVTKEVRATGFWWVDALKKNKDKKKMSEGLIAWNCDFCGHSGLEISKAGIIYCPNCKKSYGDDLFKKLDEKFKNDSPGMD